MISLTYRASGTWPGGYALFRVCLNVFPVPHMSSSTPGILDGELTSDLIRSAVLGFAFGSILFVLSDQTGMVGYALHGIGLHEAAEHLGVKQLAIFGIFAGVTTDLIVKLFGRGRRLLRPLFGRER